MVDRTLMALSRARRVARSMDQDAKAVDEALPALRALLDEAAISYRVVGGVAVVHHGYARTTEDIDVLVGRDALEVLEPLLASHGFERVRETRLRHRASGVVVDLLVEGRTVPRPGAAPYPSPDALAPSPDDAGVVGLPGLVELKLRANRHQDRADVVALLKRLDDAHYLRLEAAVDRTLRPALARLRDDALEELAGDGA